MMVLLSDALRRASACASKTALGREMVSVPENDAASKPMSPTVS
jgi:hypothetical protein